VGRYELVALAGEGGMGQVWIADGPHGPVALKVARAGSSSARQALVTEARALSTLSSAHAPRLLSDGSGEVHPYIAMERIRGVDLQTLIHERGPLDPDTVLGLMRQLFAALADTHDAGLVHGDVKPANLMLDRSGRLRLIDFGLSAPAWPPRNGEKLRGTPPYMAPEFVSAPDEVSTAVDVYAAGCVAFALVTGEPPFAGESEAEVFAAHLYQEVPPRIRDPRLAALVAACLSKEPSSRPSAAVLRRVAGAGRSVCPQCSVAA